MRRQSNSTPSRDQLELLPTSYKVGDLVWFTPPTGRMIERGVIEAESITVPGSYFVRLLSGPRIIHGPFAPHLLDMIKD